MKYILMLIGLLGIWTGIYGYVYDGELINSTGEMLYFVMIVFGIILFFSGVYHKKYNGLKTILLLFLASGISAQSIPELPNIEWGQTSEQVRDIINTQGTNLIVHSISETSPTLSNIIAGQDTVSNYTFMFVHDQLRMVTCNIDWRIHYEYMLIVQKEEVSEFYISEEVEFYKWKYGNTSRTLSYDEKGEKLSVYWNYNTQ